MRKIEEIENDYRLNINKRGENWLSGSITLAASKLKTINAIYSYGGEWEHCSVVAQGGRIPEWDDMCRIKDIFWGDEETVYQIHPPKSEYVNLVDNCLHLWRPTSGKIVLPKEWENEKE